MSISKRTESLCSRTFITPVGNSRSTASRRPFTESTASCAEPRCRRKPINSSLLMRPAPFASAKSCRSPGSLYSCFWGCCAPFGLSIRCWGPAVWRPIGSQTASHRHRADEMFLMRPRLSLILILACFGALFLDCYAPALFRDRQITYRDAGHYYYPPYKLIQEE